MKYDREDKVHILTEYYENKFDSLAKTMDRRVGGCYSGEDVVQEAMLRAIVYIDSYDPAQPVSHWFSVILLNTMKSFKREQRHMGMSRDDEEAEGHEPISEALSDVVQRRDLLQAIIHDVDMLREPEREIIRRFVFLGDKAKPIARTVNESVPMVRKIVAGFYSNIRERYAGA